MDRVRPLHDLRADGPLTARGTSHHEDHSKRRKQSPTEYLLSSRRFELGRGGGGGGNITAQSGPGILVTVLHSHWSSQGENLYVFVLKNGLPHLFSLRFELGGGGGGET